MAKSVFSILVRNRYGVLTKVAGVFGRRGCNIQSLTVCATKDPGLSRITVAADDSDDTIRQVYNQTSRLEDVQDITLLPEGDCYERTLALLRMKRGAAVNLPYELFEEGALHIAAREFRGDAVLEVLGPTETVNALIERLADGIIDLSRSGATALQIEELRDKR